MQLEVFDRRQKSKLQRREQAKKSSVAAVIPPTDSACLQDSSRHPAVEQFLTGESPVKESTHIELENDLQPIPDPETPPCVGPRGLSAARGYDQDTHGLGMHRCLVLSLISPSGSRLDGIHMQL